MCNFLFEPIALITVSRRVQVGSFSGSCIIHISDNKMVLINDKTSIFNSSGFVQALTGLHPDFPRQQHGCGYYKNSENKEVLFLDQTESLAFTLLIRSN